MGSGARHDGRSSPAPARKPLLFVDVDGVISTWGFSAPPAGMLIGAAAGQPSGATGTFHTVDGILHHIGAEMDRRLAELAPHFEMIWATGWGERANEHLVFLLGMPGELEVVDFEVEPSKDGSGHWKLKALTARAGSLPAAWIDDGLNEACQEWAGAREAPTLLVPTDPAIGLTDEHVEQLITWAAGLG